MPRRKRSSEPDTRPGQSIEDALDLCDSDDDGGGAAAAAAIANVDTVGSSGTSSDAAKAPSRSSKRLLKKAERPNGDVVLFTFPTQEVPTTGASAVTVTYEDLRRLRPGKDGKVFAAEQMLLNDNTIDFYSRYLTVGAPERPIAVRQYLPGFTEEQRSRIHIVSTFFLKRLRMTLNQNKDPSSLLGWFKRIDLFKKDLIFVPVHESRMSGHWALAVICFPGLCVQKLDAQQLQMKIEAAEAKVRAEQEAKDKAATAKRAKGRRPTAAASKTICAPDGSEAEAKAEAAEDAAERGDKEVSSDDASGDVDTSGGRDSACAAAAASMAVETRNEMSADGDEVEAAGAKETDLQDRRSGEPKSQAEEKSCVESKASGRELEPAAKDASDDDEPIAASSGEVKGLVTNPGDTASSGEVKGLVSNPGETGGSSSKLGEPSAEVRGRPCLLFLDSYMSNETKKVRRHPIAVQPLLLRTLYAHTFFPFHACLCVSSFSNACSSSAN